MSKTTKKPVPPAKIRFSSPKVNRQPKTPINESNVNLSLADSLSNILAEHLGNQPVKQIDPIYHELEFRLGSYSLDGSKYHAFVPLLVFNRLIHYYLDKLTEYKRELSIDIIYDESFRATITGDSLAASKNLIQFFAQTNKLKQATFMEKQTVLHTNVPDWYFRLTSSTEQKITGQTKILELTKVLEDRTSSKFFRYKDRYSFNLDTHFRLDLTVVKEGGPAGTLRTSNTLDKQNKEKYQVELEYIGRDFNSESIANILHSHMAELIQVYKNTILPISQSHSDLVIAKYLQFISGESNLPREYLRDNPTQKFLPVDVVALTRENFDSIFSHYHVTIKADGQHYILYLHPELGIYLINNRLEATPVVLRDSVEHLVSNESIFDGELVQYQGRNRFLIFDCFFYEGKDLRDLPLFEDENTNDKTRFFYVLALTTKISNELLSDHLIVEAKQHFPVSKIKRFFDPEHDWAIKDNEYPYLIDGLVFTPSDSAYPKINYQNGRFHKGDAEYPLLKWKPPQFLSVDFRVKLDHTETINNIVYQVVTLECSYGFESIQPFEPSAYRVNGYNRAYIPLTENLPKIIAKKGLRVEESSVGHIIKNNDIIEFVWVNDRSFGSDFWGIWVPIKYRDDKTQLGYPNNYAIVADPTWLAIHDKQITSMMLVKIDASPQLNLGYYQKSRFDEKIMVDLKNIHNAIKSLLIHLSIRTAPKKSDRLMDLATGRGGDLSKWVGIRYVLGVEYDESNLKAGRSSAYARYRDYLNKWYQLGRVPHLKADLISGNMALSMEDNNFSPEPVHNYILRKAINTPENFGIISCQFAIHYICDTEEHIDNFFRNVSRNLASDGYFVATTFDGEKIWNALKASGDKKAEISGYTKKDELLWQISAVSDIKQFANFGQKVSVLNRTIKEDAEIEYLVNFNYLIKVAQKHNLFPAHLWFEKQTLPADGNYGIGSFKEAYSEGFVNLLTDTKILPEEVLGHVKQSIQRIPAAEKQFSLFNSFLILKKGE